MKQGGVIDDRFEAVIREFQGVISFGYLILILLGMIFESIYYGQFGINIFRYSGIFDFLLVPFRRPVVLVILVGLSIFTYLYFIALYNYLREKNPKLHKSIYRDRPGGSGSLKGRIKWLIIFFIITTSAWAYVTSKKEKEHLLRRNPDISIEYDAAGNNSIRGKLIGKNDMNIFLLDESNKVRILPASSGIMSIRPLE